ncbi:hypothetical protein Csa_014205 [Cucumis sativus]|uniref:Uncharacterized protein n=1 Tax=Cucumis sativus TaxID=3659 RepID=A0A0A0LPT4_CUCSA|nr:hypothetical protein Csa_014205 [Cucumis sativus]
MKDTLQSVGDKHQTDDTKYYQSSSFSLYNHTHPIENFSFFNFTFLIFSKNQDPNSSHAILTFVAIAKTDRTDSFCYSVTSSHSSKFGESARWVCR